MALTKRQKDALDNHSEHHSAKHIKVMKAAMNKGQTFTQSHKTAMKKVGK